MSVYGKSVPSLDGEIRRRRGPVRPSLLDEVRLGDGRLAWPVAVANGVHEATFRARLSAGKSPDDAVKPVHRLILPGGHTVAAAARSAGLDPLTVRSRIKRGVPLADAAKPLDRPRLADGRLASAVAKSNGVSAAAFHYRIKAGWSVVSAIQPVGSASKARNL